jgi:hypothetical protein
MISTLKSLVLGFLFYPILPFYVAFLLCLNNCKILEPATQASKWRKPYHYSFSTDTYWEGKHTRGMWWNLCINYTLEDIIYTKSHKYKDYNSYHIYVESFHNYLIYLIPDNICCFALIWIDIYTRNNLKNLYARLRTFYKCVFSFMQIM